MKVHPTTGVDVRGASGWVPGHLAEVRAGGSTGHVGSFGMTRNGGTKMHKGTDYLCDVGDAVFAAMDGQVFRSGESIPLGSVSQDGRKGYGYRCYIKHGVTGDGKKIETRYAHLGALLVKPDQFVRAGEVIGFAGRSGNVYRDVPTHLHFEVRINGNPVDPVQWLR